MVEQLHLVQHPVTLVAADCVFYQGLHYIGQRGTMVHDDLEHPSLHVLHEILELLVEPLVILVSQLFKDLIRHRKVNRTHIHYILVHRPRPEGGLVVDLL